ncbi:GTPase [Actinomycetaceae bacterium L2_0104]
MNARTTSRELANLVERTISALENARLPLEMPGSIALAESRAQLLTQLKTRILPHLRTVGLPAVVVFGGSSGAGKSTLFNSLLGEEISPASVIRPTTRMPLIAVHPSDVVTLAGHGLLDMGKLAPTEGGIPGVILVDAPDLDSVEAANRELSRRLLDAADLWVFVTTAARYGDAQAWQTLSDAHRRGMTTAVVLNRVSEKARTTVRADLFKRMGEVGIGDDPLMLVPDAGPHEGLLSPDDVKEVRSWLEAIAASRIGAALVDRTTQAMLPELRRQLLELSEAVELQANSVQDLRDRVDLAAAQPLSKLTTNAKMGRYGQGAPTTSWLSFASSGGVLAPLATGERPGRWQRRQQGSRDSAITAVFDGVVNAVRVGLNQGIITTDEAIQTAWREDVVETAEYRRAGHDAINQLEIVNEAIVGWKSDLFALASSVGENPWLGQAGIAALLGAAAGGVAGAEQTASSNKLSATVRSARQALAERLEFAIGRVTTSYRSVLDGIEIGNGRQLRLRASEYLDRI